ncbi:MAG: hypothetical protein Kow00127_02780 [Bacteroidales bacterium]
MVFIFLLSSLTAVTQTEPVDIAGDTTLPVRYSLFDAHREGFRRAQAAGGCWSAAAMFSLESAIKTKQGSVKQLSDRHLYRFHGFDSSRTVNGNHYMITAYLTRFDGPVESGGPCDSIKHDPACPLPVKVTEAHFLPGNPGLIKSAIMDYGAVWTMLAYHRSWLDTLSFQVYAPGERKINHVVSLTGWNDTLQTRYGMGAWEAQNSTELRFNGGRIYLPYAYPGLLEYNAIWPGWLPGDSSAEVWYYDTLGSYRSYGFQDSIAWGMVKFEASATGTVGAVAGWINTAGSRVKAMIFDSFDPETGHSGNLLAEIRPDPVKYAGYYTWPLQEPVTVQKGDHLWVLVRYYSPDKFPLPIEQAIEGYSMPNLSTGKCWINPDYDRWPEAWYQTGKNPDYPYLDFNLCIRLLFAPSEE